MSRVKVFLEILTIDIARDACRDDHKDGTYPKHPYQEGCYEGNPDVVSVNLRALCHTEDGYRNECHYCRSDASEKVFHPNILAELLEDESYRQDAKEGGQAGSQGADERPFVAQSLVTNEDTDVDGKDAWTRLCHRNQVKQFIMAHPMLLVYHFLLDKRYHSITATDGEKAYLEECLEEFEHYPNFVSTHFLAFTNASIQGVTSSWRPAG